MGLHHQAGNSQGAGPGREPCTAATPFIPDRLANLTGTGMQTPNPDLQSSAPERATRQKRIKRLAVGLNLVLIGLLLFGFIYYLDPNRIIGILKSADLTLFAASVALNAFTTCCIAARLWIFLRKQDIRVPFGELVSINLGVRFYSFFSPISSVGTVMRWIRLIPADKTAEGLAGLTASRVFDILLALSMGMLWGLSSLNLGGLNLYAILAYFVVLVMVVGLGLRASGPMADWANQRAAVERSRWGQWAMRGLGKLSRALGIYRRFTRGELLTLLGTALLGDLVSLLAYYLVARAINLPIAFVDLGWIRAILLLVAIAPLTLPGGFGIREVSAAVLVAALGLGVESGAAFSILLYVRSVITALLGGAVELLFNLRTIRTGFST